MIRTLFSNCRQLANRENRVVNTGRRITLSSFVSKTGLKIARNSSCNAYVRGQRKNKPIKRLQRLNYRRIAPQREVAIPMALKNAVSWPPKYPDAWTTAV
jgi:hypothetical protein